MEMIDDLKSVEKAFKSKVMHEEVLEGLSKKRKELPSKYFYDTKGSQLFDAICELDEYYITRTEFDIMKSNINEISDFLGEELMFIEYGSGSSEKIKIILDQIKGITVYVPIDISREHLLKSAAEIKQQYPDLEVIPVCADYNKIFKIPKPFREVTHKVVYFPGSTIGNFHRDEAVRFLQRIARVTGINGSLIIGVDLLKDRHILERAYNDKKGVTAQFNLNLLSHINEALGTDFRLDLFQHLALFNEEEKRIEMHLVAGEEHSVQLNGASIHFAKGERIWTESSYKYSLEDFELLAKEAGFDVKKIWMDEKRLFSVQYLTTIDD